MLKKKLFTLLAVAGLVLASAPAAQAAPILSDGHEGDYRIIFVTNDTFGAQDITIGPYNTFVSDQAAMAGSMETIDFSTTWTAVGSTGGNTGVDAIDNTSTTGAGTDIHIYTPTTTAGTYQLVATSYTDLWNAANVDLLAPIHYGDGDDSKPVINAGSDQIWTGTESDGTARPIGGDGSYLGSGEWGDDTAANITLSRGGVIDAGWIEGPSDHDGFRDNQRVYDKHFMGISDVITPGGANVVPEPTSIAIWTVIGLGLAGFGYYRTRKKK
jgi:hypothetical protein